MEEFFENEHKKKENKMNYTNYISSPYKKILTVINEVKEYISKTSQEQQRLIQDLNWTLERIASHSIYIYEINELKEKEIMSKLSEDVMGYKKLFECILEYNKKVKELTNLYNIIEAKTKNTFYNNEVYPIPKGYPKNINKGDFIGNHLSNLHIAFNCNNSIDTASIIRLNTEEKYKLDYIKQILKNIYLNNISTEKKNHYFSPTFKSRIIAKKITPSKIEKIKTDTCLPLIIKNISENSKNNLKEITGHEYIEQNRFKSNKNLGKKIREVKLNFKLMPNHVSNFITNEQKYKVINSIESNFNKSNKTIEENIKKKINKINLNNLKTPPIEKCKGYLLEKSINKSQIKSILSNNQNKINITEVNIERSLDIKQIKYYKYTSFIKEKDFNIFSLKEEIGYKKVLPIMGNAILDVNNLKNEKILSVDKLDTFLMELSEKYLPTTLYHNSLHGVDITHTICLYFLNSDAKERCQASTLDLLSLYIAALGHDMGHPGLTNGFLMNSFSDLALTYNDLSCLENYHTSSLFKLLRKEQVNIFGNLSQSDFKFVRKRIISEILSTDMVKHNDILKRIKERIRTEELINETKNNKEEKKDEKKIKLITGDEQTKFDEQQSIFDFFIHSADLGHNTKLFNISLKWVELLSNEFWVQGDKEKSLGLPISFLCDRKNTNVPKSQVGFISGIILPTFEILVTMFPSLHYTTEEAKNNLNEWKKLIEEHRLKGWTPKKLK